MCFFDLFEEEKPKNKRVRLDPLMKKALTDELIKKQKGRCMYCGRKVGRDLFDLDHKNPVSRGGGNRKSNFQLLCRTCNTRKGSLTDREFRRKYRYAGVPQTQVLPSRAIPQSKFTETPRKATPKRSGASTSRRKTATRTRVVHSGGMWDDSPICGGRGKVAGLFETVTCKKCLSKGVF